MYTNTNISTSTIARKVIRAAIPFVREALEVCEAIELASSGHACPYQAEMAALQMVCHVLPPEYDSLPPQVAVGNWFNERSPEEVERDLRLALAGDYIG
jgi:hypothetical protein